MIILLMATLAGAAGASLVLTYDPIYIYEKESEI